MSPLSHHAFAVAYSLLSFFLFLKPMRSSSVSTTYYSDVNGVLKEYSRRQVAYEGDSKDVRFSPVGELKIRCKRFEIVYQHLTMAHYQNDNGPSARENRIFLSWRITR